jgi:dihydroorotate dehydrogenase (fumarate)
MTSTDLSTTYLGLRLSSPYIAGASPLGDHLDTVRRLEDGGCAAIVLHSLFEEQVSEMQTGRIHEMDPLDPQFARILSHFPRPGQYVFSPLQYLEHIRKIKEAVRIPVIASLNGTSAHAWITFATEVASAGADAIELNTYEVVTDPTQSGAAIEHAQYEIVKALKHELKIPVSVKVAPFFTAFAHVAREFERAGADGLVLFNRFLQPDIDLAGMAVWPKLSLSTDAELPLRLRWLAILRDQLHCSLAATGGVERPTDGIKALLAGADAVQLVSTVLRHGPSYFATMRDELSRWMAASGFTSLSDVRGRLRLARTEKPAAYERAQYLQTLSGWDSWLAYQASVRDGGPSSQKGS